jgi:hypothetical protein
MTSEWLIGRIYQKKQSQPILRCYPCICIEELRKTTKNLNHNSQYPGEISGFHGGEYEDCCLLGCCIV